MKKTARRQRLENSVKFRAFLFLVKHPDQKYSAARLQQEEFSDRAESTIYSNLKIMADAGYLRYETEGKEFWWTEDCRKWQGGSIDATA